MPHAREDIPQAASFDVAFCGHCPNAHVIFRGENGELWQAVISAAQADNLAKAIRARDPNYREIGAESGFFPPKGV